MQASRRHRNFLPALALLAIAFSACTSDIVRETGTHPDGSSAFEREYVRTEDGGLVPHGAHATWHPGGEVRSTLRHFVHGRPVGHVFEWDARGRLVRFASCQGGICVERSRPERASRAASVLATTRFRRESVRVAALDRIP